MEPHPQLASYYGAREHKSGFVGRLFAAAAPHYDAASRIVSLGSDTRYRKTALGRAGLAPGMRMLDVATGTGLMARSADVILGGAGAVTGVDPSMAMLRGGQELRSIRVARAIAERLP